MYKILLVDDELFVLSGMKKLLDSYGNFEIRTALGGLQALTVMEEFNADIIFTDIKMPNLSGLELIDKLVIRNTACKIIILSGFDSFEYAQYAIKNNVRDYLLKPVTKSQLTQTLERVLKEIDKECSLNQYMGELKQRLEDNLPVLKERLFFELSKGIFNQNLAALFHLDKEVPQMRFAALAVDQPLVRTDFSLSQDIQMSILWVQKLAKDYFTQKLDYCTFQDRDTLILVLFPTPGQGNNTLEVILQEFQKFISMKTGGTISLGISLQFLKLSGCHAAMEQAGTALGKRLYFGEQTLVFYEDLDQDHRQQRLPDMAGQQNRIISLLETEDFVTALKQMEELKRQLKTLPQADSTYIRAIATNLYLHLCLLASSKSVDRNLSEFLSGTHFENLEQAATIDAMFELLTSFCSQIEEQLAARTADRSQSMLTTIRKYTKDHISESLSLETLSKVVYMSPNYIGLIFKKETGESYKDYLLRQRMELAKKLLLENQLKIYEIAEKAGYKNVVYFSKIFKTWTGVYPSDFTC